MLAQLWIWPVWVANWKNVRKDLTHSPCAPVRARSVDEVPDAQACEPEFIPGAHVKVEGKDWLRHAVLWRTYTMPHKQTPHRHVHTCTIVKMLLLKFQVCICFPHQLQFLESVLWLYLACWAETHLGGCLLWMSVILKREGKTYCWAPVSITHPLREINSNALTQKLWKLWEAGTRPYKNLICFHSHRKIWKHTQKQLQVVSSLRSGDGDGGARLDSCSPALLKFLPPLAYWFLYLGPAMSSYCFYN